MRSRVALALAGLITVTAIVSESDAGIASPAVRLASTVRSPPMPARSALNTPTKAETAAALGTTARPVIVYSPERQPFHAVLRHPQQEGPRRRLRRRDDQGQQQSAYPERRRRESDLALAPRTRQRH